MKKKITMLLTALLLIGLLASCAPETETPDNNSSTADISQTSDISEVNNDKRPIKLTPVNADIKYVPSSTSADTITEEECELLAIDMYTDAFSIIQEFYGYAVYLFGTKGSTNPDEIVYSEVQYIPTTATVSTIVFENDAEKLRGILDTYLTDDFQELAFSLKYPCPIYEENGVLYRTSYETGNGMRGLDFAGGRIISRDNGVVRYAFPMYYINLENNEIEDRVQQLAYMDFAYKDGKWKLNDCRFSDTLYSSRYYPGGKAEIAIDAFDALEDELTVDGISVALGKNDEAVMVYNGKSAKLPIKNATNKIRKIEKANGNIFISFLGAFENNETVVVSEETLDVVATFVSDGYCITENGWNYVVIDRATQSYLIKDKDGSVLRDCAAVKQEHADAFCLPRIAPIQKIEIVDGQYVISYDTSAY